MLQKINQPRLCNATQQAVKKLLDNVIKATILKGKYKGEDVLIPASQWYQLMYHFNLNDNNFQCGLLSLIL